MSTKKSLQNLQKANSFAIWNTLREKDMSVVEEKKKDHYYSILSVSRLPLIASWQMHKASLMKQQNRHTVN